MNKIEAESSDERALAPLSEVAAHLCDHQTPCTRVRLYFLHEVCGIGNYVLQILYHFLVHKCLQQMVYEKHVAKL